MFLLTAGALDAMQLVLKNEVFMHTAGLVVTPEYRSLMNCHNKRVLKYSLWVRSTDSRRRLPSFGRVRVIVNFGMRTALNKIHCIE